MPQLFNSAQDPKASTDDRPWSVAELGQRIKSAVNDHLPRRVRVIGEVSNLSDRHHWFFSLKDDSATIRCVMFASAARAVRFPVTDGMEVVLTGRVDFYDAQGQVQLYADKLEPVGQGARELELQRLAAELRDRGYFEVDRKQPLPLVPRAVAVVTSRSAAALQDVIDTAARRWRGCRLLLFDVRVQGEDAAPQIARAIHTLSEQGPGLGIEAIILTRGGGSIEDLWAFNERAVVDAVFDCALPIVAAIGHETDTTLAELVADVRCATPTQAAMTLIPDGAGMAEQIDQLHHRLGLALKRQAAQARQRLDGLRRHPLFQSPGRVIAAAEHRLDTVIHRLHHALPRRLAPEHQRLVKLQTDLSAAPKRRLQQTAARLDALQRTLDAINPDHVLARGYTMTLDPQGKPVRQAKAANDLTRLTTVFHDGQVVSIPISQTEGTKPPAKQPRRLKPYKKPGHDEPTLFA